MTSIDVQEDVADRARSALTAAGYRSRGTGGAGDGYPGSAGERFDG